jgi:hypothetical protein
VPAEAAALARDFVAVEFVSTDFVAVDLPALDAVRPDFVAADFRSLRTPQLYQPSHSPTTPSATFRCFGAIAGLPATDPLTVGVLLSWFESHPDTQGGACDLLDDRRPRHEKLFSGGSHAASGLPLVRVQPRIATRTLGQAQDWSGKREVLMSTHGRYGTKLKDPSGR